MDRVVVLVDETMSLITHLGWWWGRWFRVLVGVLATVVGVTMKMVGVCAMMVRFM